jgi:hypothetical protein
MQSEKMNKLSYMEAPALHIANAIMAIAMALTWQLHTATWRNPCVHTFHHMFLSSCSLQQATQSLDGGPSPDDASKVELDNSILFICMS